MAPKPDPDYRNGGLGLLITDLVVALGVLWAWAINGGHLSHPVIVAADVTMGALALIAVLMIMLG